MNFATQLSSDDKKICAGVSESGVGNNFTPHQPLCSCQNANIYILRCNLLAWGWQHRGVGVNLPPQNLPLSILVQFFFNVTAK